MTTWRKEFESNTDRRDSARVLSRYGEPLRRDDSPVVAVAPDESVLDIEFDDSYGLSQGPPVLIWTEERVYFPVVYDGSEWLGSAPRNPTAEGQRHVGGQ